jgi:hypothetical protein
VQCLFALGKVQAKLVVTRFGEEARAWHSRHTNGAAEPVGARLIVAKAKIRYVYEHVVRALWFSEAQA